MVMEDGCASQRWVRLNRIDEDPQAAIPVCASFELARFAEGPRQLVVEGECPELEKPLPLLLAEHVGLVERPVKNLLWIGLASSVLVREQREDPGVSLLDGHCMADLCDAVPIEPAVDRFHHPAAQLIGMGAVPWPRPLDVVASELRFGRVDVDHDQSLVAGWG